MAIEPQESREAEMSVIGGMLKSKKSLEEAFTVLEVDDFFHKDLQLVFKAIEVLHATGVTPDQLTVHQKLSDLHLLEEAKSPEVLAECLAAVPNQDNILHYCRIVKDKSGRRQLVEACRNVAMSTTESEINGAEMMENARRIFSNMKVTMDPLTSATVQEESKRLIQEVEGFYASGEGQKLLLTGYKALDTAFDGIMNYEMVGICGLPGSGKSTLGLNIMSNLCGGPQKCSGGILSLEMERDAYLKKIYAHEAHIPLYKFKRVLSQDEIQELRQAEKHVSKWNLVIDDERRLSISSMIKKFRNMVKIHGVDFILVDYFQQLYNDSRKNEYEFLCNASKAIYDFTREMHVPVILLLQANRKMIGKDAEPDYDKIDCGAQVGKDCDKLVFIKWASKQNENHVANVDLHLIKNRFGPTWRILPFQFDGQYSRFIEDTHTF